MTWFWVNHHPLCLTPRFLLILWPGLIAERWIKGAKEGEVKQTKLQIMTDPRGGGRRSQTKTNALNIMRGGKLTPARIKGLKVETQKERKKEFSKGARWRERGTEKMMERKVCWTPFSLRSFCRPGGAMWVFVQVADYSYFSAKVFLPSLCQFPQIAFLNLLPSLFSHLPALFRTRFLPLFGSLRERK